MREGGARGARQARGSLCVGARGWQHEFGRQWFCAPSCASAALFSAQSFAVGCGGHRCTAEQVARLLVAIATLLDAFYLREMGLTSHNWLGQSASSLGLNAAVAILNERSDPSQPSADAPHRLPSTLRATGHEPPSLASGSQARRRTVGPARMTLQRSPQPSRAKGRVSATLERRMQRQSWAA